MRIDAHWLHTASVQHLYALLNATSAKTLFAGGCVRDAILGRDVADIDMATTLPAHDVMQRLQAADMKVLPTGLQHGTVTAVLADRQVEITTLRQDVATDGRRATVAYTDDWTLDAARRDFTMNALYADIEGNILDPLGGLQDVQQGRVVFIGDPLARIREDYLRILRYFRFYAWYQRTAPDVAALAACASMAEGLQQLSGERIQHEMRRLLIAPSPDAALVLLHQSGIWQYIGLDTVAILRPLAPLMCLGGDAPWLRLLYHTDMNASAALHVSNAWCLSRRDTTYLLAMATWQTALPNLQDARVRYHWIDQWTAEDYRDGLALYAALKKLDDQTVADWRAEATRLKAVAFPLTGRDLLDAGFEPGTALGAALDNARQSWVASGFTMNKQQLVMKVTKS